MPDSLIPIFRVAWIFLIATFCVNFFMMRVAVRRTVRAHPDLAAAYRQAGREYVIFMMTPGLILAILMGISLMSGGVPTPWHFLCWRDGNPLVLAFWVAVIYWWISTTYWVVVRGGAEKLVDFRRALWRVWYPRASAGMIKLGYLLAPIIGIVGFLMMSTIMACPLST